MKVGITLPLGLFTEFGGFGISTCSASIGASDYRCSHEVATACSCGRESTEPVSFENQATKWRQERSLSPLRGFRILGGHFLWTYVHSYTLSPLSWLYAEHKARSQQSEAYRNHPTMAKLIPAVRPS